MMTSQKFFVFLLNTAQKLLYSSHFIRTFLIKPIQNKCARYRNITPAFNSRIPKIYYNARSFATFEDVKRATSKGNILIIDVRNPEEFTGGHIPGSINIPLDELEEALGSTNDKFKERYKRSKPDKNSQIIFSCKSGRRGEKAQQIAINLGYRNAENFEGGYTEWTEKNKWNF